jgi:hypothetical protein
MSRTLTSMSSMVSLFYHVAVAEGRDFAAWHAPGAFAEESAAVAVVILWGVVGEFAAIVAHLSPTSSFRSFSAWASQAV